MSHYRIDLNITLRVGGHWEDQSFELDADSIEDAINKAELLQEDGELPIDYYDARIVGVQLLWEGDTEPVDRQLRRIGAATLPGLEL